MLKDVYRRLCGLLSDAGIEAPEYEARVLIESETGFSRASQIARADEPIPPETEQKLLSLAQKRAQRYPLQYLIGKWSFMGFDFKVGDGVLIPRDDTEVAANLCLDYLKNRPNAEAIDLCAGSGALCVALSKLGKAEFTAVELSGKAFNFLKKNIKLNNADVTAVQGDVFECCKNFENGRFDLIVSNPPYIKTDEIKTLQPEVGFEPSLALDGGNDGLIFYRSIIKNWSSKLKSGGALVFELGEGQAEYVSGLMSDSGYINIETADDLGGTKRAIIGIKR